MPDVCKPWLILPGFGQCKLPEADKPWLMVHIVVRLKCLPTNVYTPWVMRASLV